MEALFGSGLTVVGVYVAGNGGVVVIRLLCKTPGERENLVPGCVCDRIGASVCRVARFVPFRFDYCNRYIVGKQEGGGGQILFLMVLIPILGEAFAGFDERRIFGGSKVVSQQCRC